MKLTDHHPRGRHRAFTLIELIVTMAIIAVLIALLMPAIQAARETARRLQCVANLKQLGIAMHAYHDAYQALPIGRQNYPRRAWSYGILGYIEQRPMFDSINFSTAFWEPSNITVGLVNLSAFDCPSDPNGSINTIEEPTSPYPRAKGNYMVCWGNATWTQAPDTFIGPEGPMHFLDAPFTSEKSFRLPDFRDGTSTTLLMSEVIVGENRGFNSDHRGDIYNDDMNCSMFMTYTLPNSSVPDQVSGWCQYPAGYNPPCNANGPAFNAARSFHGGGVNALLADGHVRFVRDSISLAVWRSLSTIGAGETEGEY